MRGLVLLFLALAVELLPPRRSALGVALQRLGLPPTKRLVVGRFFRRRFR